MCAYYNQCLGPHDVTTLAILAVDKKASCYVDTGMFAVNIGTLLPLARLLLDRKYYIATGSHTLCRVLWSANLAPSPGTASSFPPACAMLCSYYSPLCQWCGASPTLQQGRPLCARASASSRYIVTSDRA